MAAINLDKLTLEELKQLQKDVGKAIKGFETKRMKAALAAAEAAAREHGFSLSNLADASKGKPKAASPPKYKHPENPSITWSGRGRKPAWFLAAIEAGTPENDLLI